MHHRNANYFALEVNVTLSRAYFFLPSSYFSLVRVLFPHNTRPDLLV
jgi:hypothetical protein